VDRFARSARVEIAASEGRNIRDDYPSFEPVRIYYDDGAGDVLKMTGFVVEFKQKGKAGVVLGILSGDFLLRRRDDLFISYAAKAISFILQDLIESYSPLEWDGANIDVRNDRVLTREWRGVRMDEIIQELSILSYNEEFGADNNLKFFFRPRDKSSAPISFTDSNIINADEEYSETEAFDRVVVYYPDAIAGADKAVTATRFDRAAENQARVGTVRPIIRAESFDHREITVEADAIQKAEEHLIKADPLIIISIETIGYPDLLPGEQVSVTSTDLGLLTPTFFVIAEIIWEAASDKTMVKLIKNSGGVVDVILALTTEKTRVDMKDAAAGVAVVETNKVKQPIQVKITNLLIRIPSLDTGFFRFGVFDEPIGPPGVGGTVGSSFIGYTEALNESY